VLAWSLWLATLGCCAAGLAVTLAVTRPLTIAVLVEGAAKALAYPLGYATIGLVLTLRRPANPIGWLYAAGGLVWSLAIPGDAWVGQLVAEHRPLPLAAQVAAVCGEFNWAPATVLGVTLPALLVPDGRLRSRRWRPVAALGIAAAALVVMGGGLAPARLEDTSIANPFGLAGLAGAVASMLAAAGVLLWAATMVASLACVVVRFRSSVGAERQQLRWVAVGAVAAVAGLLAGAALPQKTVISSSLYAMVLCIPLAVAVAVLRYRLWDLDRLISRTLTYTLVTALLVVPYLLIVPAAGRLVQGSGSLAVAAATLAVEGFATRLRDQVDLDALSAELLAVVHHTMQPVGASLWLRPQAPHPAPETTR
jgi:hypothetical protein